MYAIHPTLYEEGDAILLAATAEQEEMLTAASRGQS